MNAFLNLIDSIISLYLYVVFAAVISSWLIAFNVINMSNRFVYVVVEFLNKCTEPLLEPIRRFMPNLGGIDLSPIVLILLLLFLRDFLFEMAR